MSGDRLAILDALEDGPASTGDLVIRCNLPLWRVQHAITVLRSSKRIRLVTVRPCLSPAYGRKFEGIYAVIETEEAA